MIDLFCSFLHHTARIYRNYTSISMDTKDAVKKTPKEKEVVANNTQQVSTHRRIPRIMVFVEVS